MYQPLQHTLLHQTLWLSPNRTMYWQQQQTLILSDLHLGKTTHFRKAGIAIPTPVASNNMHRLLQDVQHFNPTKIIIVGDLFHSHANAENKLFEKYRDTINHIPIHLIQGNHDTLTLQTHAQLGLQVHNTELLQAPFLFTHMPPIIKPNTYTISGHIHPAISMQGAGRQSLRLACFYFDINYAILPAFGSFTGMYNISPSKHSSTYAVTPTEVIAL